MKSSPLQAGFNAGEVAAELEGRVDIGKYGAACSRMENFFPLVQGPARRRGGTKFVAEIKDSGDRCWLATFEFSTTQTYILEFGDRYVRLFTDNGTLLAGTVTAYNAGTAYVPGNLASDAGVNYYCIANTTGNAPPNTTYWYPMPSSGILEIPSPYALADLTAADGTFALQMVQSGDILYICHPSYAVRKLSRLGAVAWVFTSMTAVGGPFNDYDPDGTITVYAGAATGSVTVTASSASFASTDVGRLIYIEQKKINALTMWEFDKAITANALRRSSGKNYKALTSGQTGGVRPTHTVGAEYDGDTGVQWEFQDPGYGWGIITAFGSSTSITVTVQSRLPDQVVGSGNPTTRWALGSWGSVPGYPSHCAFFRNRLVFARSSDRKVWFSESADYEKFRDRDPGGIVTADMSVTVTVESDQSSNALQYMIALDVLILGTTAGEHICTVQTDADPFGPENTLIYKATEFGSRGTKPARVGSTVLFVQRSGRKLREIAYDSLYNTYPALDMSVLAPHSIPKGMHITQFAYQKEPHSIVWLARSDGLLLGFTYNREQYNDPPFGGWHRHPLGGSGIVESVACIPSPDNGRDDLWLIVRRTIDGATVRYVEYMQAEYESGDDQEDCFYVDCGLTYDGAPADNLSGLDHLEGATVDVLADGAVHPQCVVVGGEITLNREVSTAQVGLPCPAKIATMRLNPASADGTSQGKTKRINRVVLRFMDTLGGTTGPSESSLDTILFRSASDPMDSAPPLFSGDKEIAWSGGYEKEGIIWYVNDQPLPATLIAIMPQVTSNDR